MASTVFPVAPATSFNPELTYHLKKIMVAHDASQGSHRALQDAVALARYFKSELVLAYVNPPFEANADSVAEVQRENASHQADIDEITSDLNATGLHSRGLLRGGIVGDTLFNLCCDESVDLLLLGAYGYGSQERRALGSTTEFLLRAVPCLALTYGPEVNSSVLSTHHKGPILVPISFPCGIEDLKGAINVAKLFATRLEILHVAKGGSEQSTRSAEWLCERLAEQMRLEGAHVQWSVYCGVPSEIIRARSSELDSPFVLMPLKWGKNLSSVTSDNVGAAVIRRSHIPVMTYSRRKTTASDRS